MKAIEKLNAMLGGNFLTNSSSDRQAAYQLVNEGQTTLGHYSGSGRFTKAVTNSVEFLHPMVEFERFNDAPKGGVSGEKAKLVKINAKLVNERYAKFVESGKAGKERAKLKAQQRREELKRIAKENGFESVAALKRANAAIIQSNTERTDNALQQRLERFKELHGRPADLLRVRDRVMMSQINVEYDREFIRPLI